MPQSPELAGGAGFTFEGDVAALYLSHLLAESYAPGTGDRTVFRVRVQQRDFGNQLDDVIVDSKSANGESAQLSLQVKRSLTISNAKSNFDFREIIKDSWATFKKDDFQRNQDRFGVAVGEVTSEKGRALTTLCELARESLSTDHFQIRFTDSGNASNALKDVKDCIANLICEFNGEPCTGEELHQFLAHFLLIRFDFLHEGSINRPETLTRIRDCLIPSESSKAPLVFSRLVELARSSAGSSGEFDRARLIRAISQLAILKVVSSLQPTIDKLNALGRSYIDGIQDDVGGISLERTSLLEQLNSKIIQSRLVQIRGLPGSGKSVLLKQCVLKALERGSVLFLKADQLEGSSWINFATLHGLSNHALSDLLIEIGATGTPIFYLDAINRIGIEHQPVVLEVIRTIINTPLLNNWKIVVTIRDIGIESLGNWIGTILDNLRIETIEVGELDDAEANVLSKAMPQLHDLLFGSKQVREIVRRPFFIKILNQSISVKNSNAQFQPKSEIDLIENWWRHGGYNANGQDLINRQIAILEFAKLRSLEISRPIRMRDLTSNSQNLLNGFLVDGILQQVELGISFQFAHDIFFEWAFFYVLVEQGEGWLEQIKTSGEPPAVARVVELLSQREYFLEKNWATFLTVTSSLNVRSQWMRAWLLGPLGSENFQLNTAQYRSVLFADDFKLLKKALVWFQAEKTAPNPNILFGDLDPDERIRFADLLGYPSDFSSWRRLIVFLLRHNAEIPVRLYPDIVAIFEVWQNALFDYKNPCSHELVKTCAAWLIELDEYYENNNSKFSTNRWNDLPNTEDFRKSLSRLVLSTSRIEPEFAEEYLKRVIKKDQIRKKSYEEIVAFSPTLSLSHAHLLVELTLAYLKDELPDDKIARERSEAEKYAEKRRQDSLNTKNKKDSKSKTYFSSSPFVDCNQFSDFDWDRLSIDRDLQNFYPESPLREPFNSLFRNSPTEALHLLNQLSNHAITAWRQLHRHIRNSPGTPVPLELNFPWGTQLFWGGARQYLWCRAIWAPKPLACGFMALEEWCFSELNRGRSADELIQQIVFGNASIAILGVASMIALHTNEISETVFTLITSQRLLHADSQRRLQDFSSKYGNLIGLNPRTDQLHIKAIQSACVREVRQKQLTDLIPHYMFDGKFSEATKAEIINSKTSQHTNMQNIVKIPKLKSIFLSRLKYIQSLLT